MELCLSSDLQIFQQNGRIGAPGEYGRLEITICKMCGFKMQNPRFPDDFYETYYQHLYREVAFGSLSPSDVYISQQKARGQNVRAWYESHFGSSGTMLDHGCASGGTMLGWLEKGWNCKGLDPHKPSVEAGIKMGLDIKIGTGESLPFNDSSFDLVLSLGSLEHSYNLKKSLAEIHRTLKANGHLVIRWRSTLFLALLSNITITTITVFSHHERLRWPSKFWFQCCPNYRRKLELEAIHTSSLQKSISMTCQAQTT